MNNTLLSNQLENIKGLHPVLAKSALAVYTEPEVQEAMRVLGKYGLGVVLPHRHDEQDKLVPLSHDEVQSEAQLRISFIKKHRVDPAAVIVAWRAGANGEIDFTSECSWLHSCVGAHRSDQPEPPPPPKPKPKPKHQISMNNGRCTLKN